MGFTYRAKFRYLWEFGPVIKSGIGIPINAVYVTGTPKAVDFSSARQINIFTGLDAARLAKSLGLYLPSASGRPPSDRSLSAINQAEDDLFDFSKNGAEFFFSFSILKYIDGKLFEAQVLRDDAASCRGFLPGSSLGNQWAFRLPSAKVINASPSAVDVLQP